MTTLHNETFKIESLGFSGGERHIQLSHLPSVLNGPVNIRVDLINSDALFDLLLFDNALRHHYKKQISLNLEIPYFPYARQDRVCSEGQAFSLQVMANLLKGLSINKLVVWDCHSPATIELTGAKSISPASIIKTNDKLAAILKDENSVLICPDKGAVERCNDLKNNLAVKEIVFCEKKRDPSTGHIVDTKVLIDDLTGKTAIITDDICDGGRTFIKIAEQLKNKNVREIILYVTHGIFSKGLEVFDGLIDQVYATDSFPQSENNKLTVINVNFNQGEER